MRLTDDAVADLGGLFKSDPQVVRWAFKKMIQIESDPNAGEPLLGGLIGYRKATVGNRDWRVVWRVTQDELGNYLIEVAEVWAIGFRKDSQVYDEIQQRIDVSGPNPHTRALSEVLALFAKQTRDLHATPEPQLPERVPTWLTEALLHVARIPAAAIAEMNLETAEKAWTDHISGSTADCDESLPPE